MHRIYVWARKKEEILVQLSKDKEAGRNLRQSSTFKVPTKLARGEL